MENKKKIRLTLIALAIVGAIGGGAYWNTHRFVESTDNAYVKADLTAITSKVEGHIKNLKVSDNQYVKRGDVLVELDDRDYAVQLEQLEAQVLAKEAALRVLESKMGVQNAQVAQAFALKQAADADSVRATKDANRFDALLRDQYTTTQRAETAKSEELRADAQASASAARVRVETEQLKSFSAQIEQANADLTQAKAAVEQAKNSVHDTTIVAPVDGVVGNRTSQAGLLVKPGSQLMVLMQPSSIYVQANFKETQIERMSPGRIVNLKVDSFPHVKFSGVIDSISPASGAQFSLLPQDNATGNFTKIVQRIPVKIKVTSPANYASLLKPGMSVEAETNLK